MTTMTEQTTSEPAFMTFLRNFAHKLEDQIEAEDMPGKLEWDFETIPAEQLSGKSDLTFIEMHYREEPEGEDPFISSTYRLMVGKKYQYRIPVVRLQNMDTDEELVVSANPRAVLAIISF